MLSARTPSLAFMLLAYYYRFSVLVMYISHLWCYDPISSQL